MRRIISLTILGLVMVFCLSGGHVYAQVSGDTGQKGMGHEHAGPGKGLALTPEQKAKFQEMRRNFKRDNAQLIGALVAKRIELESLWTDPNADPKAILDKSRELRAVQDQLRDKFVGAMLEARSTLTPEQIAHWKPGRMFWRHGMMMMGGWSMMHRGGMMGRCGMMGRGGMMGGEKCDCR